MSPTEIRLTQGRKQLEIEWLDGARSSLDAGYLRAHCRSSRAVRRSLDGTDTAPDDLRITDVQMVGAYAVNLAFSDGDDRGIYPWPYLRALSGLGDEDGDVARGAGDE
jgi:DUF971 family protein